MKRVVVRHVQESASQRLLLERGDIDKQLTLRILLVRELLMAFRLWMSYAVA